LLALVLAGPPRGGDAPSEAPREPSSETRAEAASETSSETPSETASETPRTAPEAGQSPDAEPAPKRRGRFWMSNEPTEEKQRRFLVGIEGVVMQAPPLRPSIVRVDPRFVGRTVALGGLGIFGRFRPMPIVAFDLSVRSGSLRLTDRD